MSGVDQPKALATSVSIGEQLLQVLGLEGQHVKRVVIEIKAVDVVNVTVERYVTNDDMYAVFGVIDVDKYKLVRREGAPE
jgi:hypothetical protein